MEIAKNCVNRQHEVIWVPSHGKHKDWRCEQFSCEVLRRLNDAADQQATLALKQDTRYRNLLGHDQECQRAHNWASEMMRRQLRGVTRYIQDNEDELEKWTSFLRPWFAEHD